jgi:hypothetical protein
LIAVLTSAYAAGVFSPRKSVAASWKEMLLYPIIVGVLLINYEVNRVDINRMVKEQIEDAAGWVIGKLSDQFIDGQVVDACRSVSYSLPGCTAYQN